MDDVSTEVRRYFRYLRQYWWLLIAGAVGGVVVMILLNRVTSSSSDAGPETQQVVLLSERWAGMSNATVPGTMFAEDQDTLAVAVARVSSDATMDELEQQLGMTSDQFTFALDGRRVLIDINADPDAARSAAELLGDELDAARVRDTLMPIELAARAIEARLADVTSEQTAQADAVGTGDASANEAARLITQLELTRAAAVAVPEELRSDVVSVRQTGSGSVVSGDFSPAQVLIGSLGGLVLAAVAIIVWSVVDRRLLTRRDVEAITGAGTLLAVMRTPPTDDDLRAAAGAVEHLRTVHPNLSLVPVRPSAADAADAIGELSGTPCVGPENLFDGSSPIACVPVARSGAVTDAEMERLKFVVERAGGVVPGVILVGGRRAVDLLD